MIQEDKDLLLKELCARLPYGVKVYFEFEPDIGEKFESHGILESINIYSQVEIDSDKLCGQLLSLEYNKVKPYLFPLSSMTVEQICKVQNLLPSNCNISFKNQEIIFYDEDNVKLEQLEKLFNLFNMWHIDYRNLITKGLAIDATRLNIY